MTDVRQRIYFYRNGESIATPGIDFNGAISCQLACGKFEVWRKKAGTYWAGNGGVPRRYVLPELWLVEIDGQYATVRAELVGRDITKGKQSMFDECRALGSTK